MKRWLGCGRTVGERVVTVIVFVFCAEESVLFVCVTTDALLLFFYADLRVKGGKRWLKSVERLLHFVYKSYLGKTIPLARFLPIQLLLSHTVLFGKHNS